MFFYDVWKSFKIAIKVDPKIHWKTPFIDISSEIRQRKHSSPRIFSNTSHHYIPWGVWKVVGQKIFGKSCLPSGHPHHHQHQLWTLSRTSFLSLATLSSVMLTVWYLLHLTFPSLHCGATRGDVHSSRTLRVQLPTYRGTMVTSEDTQDATTVFEDTHVTLVKPEDYMDRVEQQSLYLHKEGGKREGERRKNNHVRL